MVVVIVVVVVEVVVLEVAGMVSAGIVVVWVDVVVTPVASDSWKSRFYSFVDKTYVYFAENENRAVY